MTSIVVPAHNEAGVLGRLLDGLLLTNAAPDDLEVVVVCNGCTDDTAAVAALRPGVRVVQTPVPSKHAALRLGDSNCRTFPRLYVDADVEISAASVLSLVHALDDGALAAAPRRELVMDSSPWTVRAYYEVWQELPTVRQGLFGRGVIAFTADGHERAARLPEITADDLWLHHAFRSDETAIASTAVVFVHPPRTLRDLLRRRLRVVRGASAVRRRADTSAGASGTHKRDLIDIARRRPDLVPALGVFLAVTVLARAGAALEAWRGTGDVWHRDDSSRS